jgi:hypothetical protein
MTTVAPEEQALFGTWLVDTLLEKHELYIRWNDLLSQPDGASLLTISAQRVLTPLSRVALNQFEVVRAALDPVAELATIFLARPIDGIGEHRQWGQGILLVARKVPGLALHVTVVWHDWYAETRSIVQSGHFELPRQ